MRKKRLFIYGFGNFANYAEYVFTQDTNYDVAGYCIEADYLHKTCSENSQPGMYVFEDLNKIAEGTNFHIFIAVGHNELRRRIFERALELNYSIASYISSKALVWGNLITGRNVFIGEGSIIQPFVKIGDNSLHFGSRIGHHSVIGDHTLLSGTTVGGNTSIGERSFLGLNSTVQQNIRIAPRNIIGMNVSIEDHTEENAVYTHKGSQKRNLSYDQVNQRFLL